MIRLQIKNLNSNIELVDKNLISKLYQEAKLIKDYEELNDVQESQVDLSGNLQVDKAYGDEVDWLNNMFANLHINIIGSRYIKFEDPYAQEFWANTSFIGDGIGVTMENLKNLTDTHNRTLFGSDGGTHPEQEELLSHVTSLIELKYTNLTNFSSWETYVKYYAPNLKRIAFPASTVEVSSNFFNFPELEYVDTSLIDQGSFQISSCPKLEEIHMPPQQNDFWSCFCLCTSLKDIFVYSTNPNLNTTGVWMLDGTPVVNWWVQDASYNDWVTYFNNINKTNRVVLKRFSEYTGDKLIQKWIVPTTGS